MVCSHVVNWEVVSPITTAPKLVAMRPGQRDYRVLLDSRDRRPFRVTRVQCNVPGIQGRPVDTAPALRRIVELEGVPGPGHRRGVVSVFTDHPAQARVEVPFVVIN